MNASPLPDRLAQRARNCPYKPAVRMIDGSTVRTLTYRELDARATQFARWLLDVGLEEGEVFSALLENRDDALAISWAARRCGLCFAPACSSRAGEPT